MYYLSCNNRHHLLHLFFFFKQKTAYEMRISDLSSDVCSSDLRPAPPCRLRARSFRAGAFSLCGRSRGWRWHACLLSSMQGSWSARPHAELSGQRHEQPRIGFFSEEAAAVERNRQRDVEPAEVAISDAHRSEEHTSELQSLMRIPYAVFSFKTKTQYSRLDNMN